jgi:hypothetical protein
MRSFYNTSNGELRLTLQDFKNDKTLLYFSDNRILSALGISKFRTTNTGAFAVEIDKTFVSFPSPTITTPNLFVYCNITEPQIVGNTFASLLRTLSVPIGLSRGDVVNEKFIRPYYQKLWLNHIPEIQIDICDSTGRYIQFQSGTSLITLHFRGRKQGFFAGS